MITPCCILSFALLITATSPQAAWQRDFARAAAERDPVRRVEALRLFLESADPEVFSAALDVLGGCGKAALPSLNAMVRDETRQNRRVLVATLVRAGGQDAIPSLERALQEEAKYWNNLGLNLDEDAKVSAERFLYLVALLNHLDALEYCDDRSLVRSIRDRFDDHPILRRYGVLLEAGVRVGPSPVVAAADAILARH